MLVRAPALPGRYPHVKFSPPPIVVAATAFSAVIGAAPAAAETGSADPPMPSPGRCGRGDQNGEDGRSWVEWEADAGEQRSEYMVVTNHGEADVEFQLSAADGYFTDTGRFNMLPADEESVAAGTWIDVPESVVVPAGGAETVPFTVTVPENATPGDHAAGVAASIRSTGSGSVGVESRVGFRVMTRVAGDLQPQLGAAASGTYTGEINPFSSGSIDVAYEIENTGNTLLRTQPEVEVSGPFGLRTHHRHGRGDRRNRAGGDPPRNRCACPPRGRCSPTTRA